MSILEWDLQKKEREVKVKVKAKIIQKKASNLHRTL
jgi:hypothetical protein